MSKPTMETIANACGVSKATVSLAFNHPGKISKPVKDRIIEESINSGYFKHHQLKGQKIHLIFDKFEEIILGEYYREVVHGILSRIMQSKLDIRIIDHFDVGYEDVYESSGLICVGKIPEDWVIKAKGFKIPFVLCGHPPSLPGVLSVFPDFKTGYRQLIEYVISCNHQKIGLILGRFGADDPLEKLIIQTYQDTLATHNIQYKEQYIKYADYNNLQTLSIVFNELLSEKPRVSAIVFSDDQFAYQAIREAHRHGLKIPEDISITGFDGIGIPSFLEAPTPSLTTAYVDRYQVGAKAVDLLMSYIHNQDIREKTHHIPTKLTIGNSVKRLN